MNPDSYKLIGMAARTLIIKNSQRVAQLDSVIYDKTLRLFVNGE